MKTVMIFEIEQELYDQVTAVLNPLGYTLESAIVLFMEACVACNGIPFTYTQEELMRQNATLKLTSSTSTRRSDDAIIRILNAPP